MTLSVRLSKGWIRRLLSQCLRSDSGHPGEGRGCCHLATLDGGSARCDLAGLRQKVTLGPSPGRQSNMCTCAEWKSKRKSGRTGFDGLTSVGLAQRSGGPSHREATKEKTQANNFSGVFFPIIPQLTLWLALSSAVLFICIQKRKVRGQRSMSWPISVESRVAACTRLAASTLLPS